MHRRLADPAVFDLYTDFARDDWANLRAATPLTLSEADLDEVRGINESISLDEVADIYLPLSRLLNLYVEASQALYRVTDTFLGKPSAKVPYVIGIAGSVAVGKSTTARLLKTLLARWPNHPTVDLITTDGFLYPNRTLEQRSLMKRKGFPESYDLRRLVQFLADVKGGVPEVGAPVYSHLTYDVVPDEMLVVRQPDVMIVEGLNLLQTRLDSRQIPQVFVSDFFDFSIYVDADEADIRRWYIDRFLILRRTAFQDRASYFHRYAGLSEQEAISTAERIWSEINGVNLELNIRPTRTRSRLILDKGPDHAVQRVRLRKL